MPIPAIVGWVWAGAAVAVAVAVAVVDAEAQVSLIGPTWPWIWIAPIDSSRHSLLVISRGSSSTVLLEMDGQRIENGE